MIVSRRQPVVWVFAALVVLGVILGLVSGAEAAFPGANGKIAFYSDRDGNNEIYTMNADGTSQTRLTNNSASDSTPAWSPDGTKIAFTTTRDGHDEIYTMNADGTSQTRLTNNSVSDTGPAWSPDGTKIAFYTNRDGNNEVYAMNADGTGATRLTNNAALDGQPAWSPDGAKIAFTSNRDGNFELYSMDANGSNQTRLITSADTDWEPNWSPDGDKIAFAKDTGSTKLACSIDAGGGGQFCASFGGLDHPAWSPDDTRIVLDGPPPFVPGGPREIYTGTPSGNPTAQLTNNSANDQDPDWQPVVRNYARPRGATPKREPLVPAYKQCTAPNTTHQAPLSFGSCNPPQPASSFLTVGTPDFNGVGANSIGSVLFKVQTTAPEDGLIDVSLTDVRCQSISGGCAGGALSDYSGELRFDTTFRITDKLNGGVNPSGTVSDLPLRFAVPCTPTVSTTVGSTCSASTTINAVLGASAIVEGKRAIWQPSGEISLYDGGTTGVSGHPSATIFAVAGLFYP